MSLVHAARSQSVPLCIIHKQVHVHVSMTMCTWAQSEPHRLHAAEDFQCPDIVLSCTKAHHLPAALPALKRLVGPNTLLVTIQVLMHSFSIQTPPPNSGTTPHPGRASASATSEGRPDCQWMCDACCRMFLIVPIVQTS
jgi:ketopantoate reductase